MLNHSNFTEYNSSNLTLEICWQARLDLRNYGSVALFFVGLFSNMYSVFFIISRNNCVKKMNLLIYLNGLALATQIKLFFEMPFDFFIGDDMTGLFCSFIIWMRYSFGEICSWLLVIMLIDSTVSSRFGKITEVSNVNTDSLYIRCIVVCTIFLVFLIKNGVILIMNELSSFELLDFIRTNNCMRPIPGPKEFFFSPSYAYFYFAIQLIYIYLPFIVMITFNIILLYTLYEIKFMPLLNSSDLRDSKVRLMEKYARAITSVNFLCIVTTLPYEILSTIINLNVLHIESLLYYESIQFVLKFVELCSFASYSLCLVFVLPMINYSKWLEVHRKSSGRLYESMSFCCFWKNRRFDLTEPPIECKDIYIVRTREN